MNATMNEILDALEHVKALSDDAGFKEACAYLPELEAAVEHVKAALAKVEGGAA